MLGVLCAQLKPWILSSLFVHQGCVAHYLDSRLVQSPICVAANQCRRHHYTTYGISGSVGGATSIWHVILPLSGLEGGQHELWRKKVERKGEGSWNVAWDARPTRWLHRLDSAWLLFGVCACLAPMIELVEQNMEAVLNVVEKNPSSYADYKVKGVLADGRCLFRAISHSACLRKGEEVSDENHQMELADELRAQVVNELSMRREEIEW